MESLLTGLGLSGSAGLNAYLPLLIMSVSSRLGLMELNGRYEILESDIAIIVVTFLLFIEMTADKIPAVDTINDGINTLIRPTSGALLFAASTGDVSNVDPTLMTMMSIFSGSITAGAVHTVKAAVRPSVTLTTGGFGNIFVSLAEDLLSFTVSLFAILIPFVVVIFSFSFVATGGWWWWDRKRTQIYFAKNVGEKVIIPPS